MNNEIKPAVNQVEIQPFFQQEKAIKNMQKYNIQPEAWGPLSEGQKNIFCNRALDKIASKYQKSVAQIILRWNIQRNVVVMELKIHNTRDTNLLGKITSKMFYSSLKEEDPPT